MTSIFQDAKDSANLNIGELSNCLVIDENCQILEASTEICRLLTYEPVELVGQDVSFLLSQEGKAQRENFQNEILQHNITSYQGKLLIDKYGKYITSDIYIYKHCLEDNVPVYIVLIMGDLNYQAELEKKYLEKSLELNTFIYRTSHDLRGPLCTLSGLMQIFKLEHADKSTFNFIRLVESTLHKLDHTLSDLINVAEANSGIINKATLINLHALLYRTVSKVGESYNIYDSLFKIDIEQKSDFVNYENLYSSVLFNLISNAIQNLMPDRIGVIKIDLKQNADDSIVVRIEDNGKGIPLEIQGRVFDMFFKRGEQENAGLGLYLVKNYVEYMGGSIHLESEPGQGTMIQLHLPSLKAAQVEQKAS